MDGPNAPFQPRNEAEIAEFLRAHATTASPVNMCGGSSKAALGRPPLADAAAIDTSALRGITLYEPEELVLTARAGTRLAEIEAALAERGQCMAFEPPDLGPLLGARGALPTLGGTVAAGLSGPRRIKAGAVRDHVLGARAVGGDGQIFKSGGRVVKNVTGFDMPKLLTGSHGTLAVMTEITIKVLPAPATSRTLVALGLDAAAAIRLLSDALGGPFDISAAAHLPAAAAARSKIAPVSGAGGSATALRLEGFGPSVADRFTTLRTRLAVQGQALVLDEGECRCLWREIRDVATLIDPDKIVWRLSLPPNDAPRTVANIARGAPVEAIYDWGGGLVWLALPPTEDAHAVLVRSMLPSGHATLIRASVDIRAKASVFQPQQPSLAALTRRVKAAFDPCFILNPGRMYADI